MFYVKIPKSRIGVLIGKDGQIKKKVEDFAKVKITVDSEYGDVMIDDRNADMPMAMKAKAFVEAVGEGFSPDRAWKIFREDMYFEVIDIKDFVGKRENRIRVLKGRLIGKEGKTRKIIEDLSGAELSIYGYDVAIIGDYYQLETAKRAIEMLLRGSKHATIYGYLEKRHKNMKYAALDYYYIQ